MVEIELYPKGGFKGDVCKIAYTPDGLDKILLGPRCTSQVIEDVLGTMSVAVTLQSLFGREIISQFDNLNVIAKGYDEFGMPTFEKQKSASMFFTLKRTRFKDKVYGHCNLEEFEGQVLIGHIAKRVVNESPHNFADFCAVEVFDTILHETLHLLMWDWCLRSWSVEKKIDFIVNKLMKELLEIDCQNWTGVCDFYNILQDAKRHP